MSCPAHKAAAAAGMWKPSACMRGTTTELAVAREGQGQTQPPCRYVPRIRASGKVVRARALVCETGGGSSSSSSSRDSPGAVQHAAGLGTRRDEWSCSAACQQVKMRSCAWCEQHSVQHTFVVRQQAPGQHTVFTIACRTPQL
jgi:hypothetical protein